MEVTGIDGRIILECTIREVFGKSCAGSVWLRIGTVSGCCE